MALPPDYPAERIKVRLGIPPVHSRPKLVFSDHAVDQSGRPTDTVLATAIGGFSISHDLGRTWRFVRVKNYPSASVLHVKWLGNSEVLVQVAPAGAQAAKTESVDVLVVHENGTVLAKHEGLGCRWHGCRAVDLANGTLMYAEYPVNPRIDGERRHITRVFRSRDRGRTWSIAFEQPGPNIQHFHFLQARSGTPGEWWLTSGDATHECRIWISRDDGDSWTDLTEAFGKFFYIGEVGYPRKIFRLTDMAWEGSDIVWATDDVLAEATDHRGAGVFRSTVGDALDPRLVGRCNWHIRSLVDVGHSYLALSQGCPVPGQNPEAERPGVYLVPKKPPPSGPGVFHLFDVPTPPGTKIKLSASRASRAAKDGTFFSHRSPTDAFGVRPPHHGMEGYVLVIR